MEQDKIILSKHFGSIETTDGGFTLLFERKINHPAHKVWRALTDPDRMRLWLSPNLATERSDMPLTKGSTIRMQFMLAAPEGVIREIQPGTVLEIDWGQGHISRWEIRDQGERCILIFSEHLAEMFDSQTAVAWHAYMDFLEMSLDGQVVPANIPAQWPELSAEHGQFYERVLNHIGPNSDAVSMTVPTVTAQMLIRKPVRTVFEAFINPEITRHFWFTKSSGPLKKDQHITWEWEMYGVSIGVFVEEIIDDRLIQIQWDDPSTTVKFEFREIAGLGTYVEITNTGFRQRNEELWAAINDNTGGFTTVLDGAKAYLEHGVELNLIADKFPSQVTTH